MTWFLKELYAPVKKNSIGEISSGNSAHHLTSLENHNALY